MSRGVASCVARGPPKTSDVPVPLMQLYANLQSEVAREQLGFFALHCATLQVMLQIVCTSMSHTMDMQVAQQPRQICALCMLRKLHPGDL